MIVNHPTFYVSYVYFQDNDDVERTITPEPVIDQGMVDTAMSASNAADQDYQGLRPQQLQEAKDTLIVETSDMLRVPLFTAEVLLRHHGKPSVFHKPINKCLLV